jgi:isopropylmalate/homocitrate/citramalate synthase
MNKKENKSYVLLNTKNWIQYQSYRPVKSCSLTKYIFSSKRAGTTAIKTMLKRLDLQLQEAESKTHYGRMIQINQIKERIAEIKNLEVIEYNYFKDNEPMAIRTNAITGKSFSEPLNTPYYLSPSSESYFSR